MNALSGYAQATGGHVFINGDDYYRNFDAYRTVLGYVPQDDIIHRTLPVDRALGYAAQLRLPADTAAPEIAQRIARVLDDVEMTPHRDKLVENLSGGQRKRVSIGSELLADPSLFFLDEPTSGLDPGLEKKMMYTLRRLADSGRTVVLVTHATANISQCDHVAFMSDGRLVYFGPPAEALQFFNVSSGDFADIYTKLEGAASQQDPERWAVVQRDLQAEYDSSRG
jgi:ABC-type multidrug transport system ATPase subunit